MLKSYNNKKVLNLNDQFVEEVDESDLKEKKDPELREKKKINLVLILIFLLVVGLLGGSLYYAYGVIQKSYDEGDIAIVHSKVDLGLTINSFKEYTNKINSINYSFFIQNNNDKEMNYKILLSEKKVDNKIDISKLSYSLLEDNIEVETGLISNLDQSVLIGTSIKPNSKKQYIFKLWSNEGLEKSYKYEIEVSF